MSQYFYIGSKVRLIHEPDDFEDEPEPEPSPLDIGELYERQVADDTRDCLQDIQGEFAAIYRMLKQAV